MHARISSVTWRKTGEAFATSAVSPSPQPYQIGRATATGCVMSQLNEDGKKPDTVLSAVLGQCERHGDKVALHWLNGECEVVERITYGELAGRTVRLAAGLLERAAGVARGKRAVLCYPPGLEFFEVFLACIRAGVVAGERHG